MRFASDILLGGKIWLLNSYKIPSLKDKPHSPYDPMSMARSPPDMTTRSLWTLKALTLFLLCWSLFYLLPVTLWVEEGVSFKTLCMTRALEISQMLFNLKSIQTIWKYSGLCICFLAIDEGVCVNGGGISRISSLARNKRIALEKHSFILMTIKN